MRILCLGLSMALLVFPAARAAPVPPRMTAAQQLAQENWAPPLGLYVPKAANRKPPDVGKTDLAKYKADPKTPDKVRKALHGAQLLLWATSPAPPPKPLVKEVEALRKELKQVPSPLRVRVTIVEKRQREVQLDRQLLALSTQIARAVSRLQSALEGLDELDVTDLGPRDRAQVLYYRISLMARLIYLEEHAAAFGHMRKEAPSSKEEDRAWELRAKAGVGDATARKLSRTLARLYQQLSKDHPGTMWDDLAQAGLKEPLGVEWVAVR